MSWYSELRRFLSRKLGSVFPWKRSKPVLVKASCGAARFNAVYFSRLEVVFTHYWFLALLVEVAAYLHTYWLVCMQICQQPLLPLAWSYLISPFHFRRKFWPPPSPSTSLGACFACRATRGNKEACSPCAVSGCWNLKTGTETKFFREYWNPKELFVTL